MVTVKAYDEEKMLP